MDRIAASKHQKQPAPRVIVELINYFLGIKSSAAEFTQYRCPVG
jgi:hypothetical protein